MKSTTLTSPRAAERIRLLKVVTNFSSGGTEGQVHKLSQALDHELIDLQFVCLKKYGPFLKDLNASGIPVREFPIGSFYQLRTYIQICKLAMFMRRERIQICHSYNFYANLIAVPAARLAGVSIVLISIRDRGVYLSAMQQRVQRWTCRFADEILVNAEAIRNWLVCQGIPDPKIQVLKNGIDMQPYKEASAASDIRAELGIPYNARLVIMLARLNPQKGIDEVLHAAQQIKQRHPDVHFLIVGEKLDFKNGEIFQDSDYHQHLHSLTVSLGISTFVWFTGHRTDVASLLSQSALSVLPSHSEGLSNSLIESMAAGLPLVATDVGGNPELVSDGVNGLLVPVRNVDKLAAAVNAILDDPKLAARFGEASLRICHEQFSMQKMVAATQQLYFSALEKRQGKTNQENSI